MSELIRKKCNYDVSKTEVHSEVLRVRKPGGHLLSFGGTRINHRLALAVEDVGFAITKTHKVKSA